MNTFGGRRKPHGNTMRSYRRRSDSKGPVVNTFGYFLSSHHSRKQRNSINVASDLKPEHIKFKKPTFLARREKKWVANEKVCLVLKFEISN